MTLYDSGDVVRKLISQDVANLFHFPKDGKSSGVIQLNGVDLLGSVQTGIVFSVCVDWARQREDALKKVSRKDALQQ